jgi:hypothetical protein
MCVEEFLAQSLLLNVQNGIETDGRSTQAGPICWYCYKSISPSVSILRKTAITFCETINFEFLIMYDEKATIFGTFGEPLSGFIRFQTCKNAWEQVGDTCTKSRSKRHTHSRFGGATRRQQGAPTGSNPQLSPL